MTSPESPKPRATGLARRKARAGAAALGGQLVSPETANDVESTSSAPDGHTATNSAERPDTQAQLSDIDVVPTASASLTPDVVDSPVSVVPPPAPPTQRGTERFVETPVLTGVASPPAAGPAPSVGLTDTALAGRGEAVGDAAPGQQAHGRLPEEFGDILRPGAWQTDNATGATGAADGAAAATSASSSEVGQEVLEGPFGSDDTMRVGFYCTRAARSAFRRAGEVGDVELAVLAMDAIDEAIKDGTLKDLVDMRHTQSRPAESAFPSRRTRRRKPKGSKTSASKVLQQVQMTEPELDALRTIQEQVGAETRSEVISVAVEAKYDPEFVRRMRLEVGARAGNGTVVHDLD